MTACCSPSEIEAFINQVKKRRHLYLHFAKYFKKDDFFGVVYPTTEYQPGAFVKKFEDTNCNCNEQNQYSVVLPPLDMFDFYVTKLQKSSKPKSYCRFKDFCQQMDQSKDSYTCDIDFCRSFK